ncbi:hypothetical protein Q1695_005939 [Nippostrongylus brasiliensis]|nr:hypothetical protein Q1695_005939 [Nippostrongylus brasiliensis]
MFMLTLILLLAVDVETHKILIVIPKMGYSHMNFLGKIADTLVEDGHDVVTLQPVILPQVHGTGTSKSRLIQVDLKHEDIEEIMSILARDQLPVWTSDVANPTNLMTLIPVLEKMTSVAVERLLDDEALLQQLRQESFDIGIVEMFDFIGFAVFEAIGLKNVVGAHSTSGVMEATAISIGLPVIPSYTPASFGVTDDSSDLLSRAKNLLLTTLSYHFQKRIANAADEIMVDKLGHAVTPVWDTVSNMSWILANVEPLLDFARPTLHKVIDLGGIGVKEASPLTEEWNTALNLRARTILISFGSVAHAANMPIAMKKTIMRVIESYPDITFIWKYERPDDPEFSAVKNLILTKWMPQGDLLADNRTTLFVTHGGAGSLLESATHGKPLVVIPLFGDQPKNAKLVEKFGFGEFSYIQFCCLLGNC